MEPRRLHKAKRIDNSEWVEGYYRLIDGPTSPLHHFEKLDYVDNFRVYPKTLCQCTGVNDVTTSNLIYENDLVSDILGNEYVVIWELGYWCLKHTDGINKKELVGLLSMDVEVVGNIHD